MANVEFEGKDLEEAIAQAASALSLPPEQVKFTLLSMGAKGFLGLGRKKARISVDPADPALKVDEEGEARPAFKSRSDSPAASTEEAAPAERPESERRKPAHSKREKKPEKAAAPTPEKKAAASKEKERRPKDHHERKPLAPAEPEMAALDWSHVAPPLTKPAPGESIAPIENDPAGLLAVEAVSEILTRMGLAAEIKAFRLDSRLVLSLDSPDNALLIGARGITLEALQLLTGKIVTRRLKERNQPAETGARVVLDVADYRLRRQNHLLEALKTAAEQVRQSRKPQTMGGLNASERRMVQMALRPFKDLAVQTGGVRDGLTITLASASRPRRPRGHHHHPTKS